MEDLLERRIPCSYANTSLLSYVLVTLKFSPPPAPPHAPQPPQAAPGRIWNRCLDATNYTAGSTSRAGCTSAGNDSAMCNTFAWAIVFGLTLRRHRFRHRRSDSCVTQPFPSSSCSLVAIRCHNQPLASTATRGTCDQRICAVFQCGSAWNE